MKELQGQVKKLLRSFPSGGKEFLSAVEHVLAREKNWVGGRGMIARAEEGGFIN